LPLTSGKKSGGFAQNFAWLKYLYKKCAHPAPMTTNPTIEIAEINPRQKLGQSSPPLAAPNRKHISLAMPAPEFKSVIQALLPSWPTSLAR